MKECFWPGETTQADDAQSAVDGARRGRGIAVKSRPRSGNFVFMLVLLLPVSWMRNFAPFSLLPASWGAVRWRGESEPRGSSGLWKGYTRCTARYGCNCRQASCWRAWQGESIEAWHGEPFRGAL
jgi:hypothetical protein